MGDFNIGLNQSFEKSFSPKKLNSLKLWLRSSSDITLGDVNNQYKLETSGNLTRENSSKLQINSKNFSIHIQIKCDFLPESIINLVYRDTQIFFRLNLSGLIECELVDSDLKTRNNISLTNICDGNYHDVVLIVNYESGNYLYIDNELESSDTIRFTGDIINTNLINIGNTTETSKLFYIKFVRIFNKVLSLFEISNLNTQESIPAEYQWSDNESLISNPSFENWDSMNEVTLDGVDQHMYRNAPTNLIPIESSNFDTDGIDYWSTNNLTKTYDSVNKWMVLQVSKVSNIQNLYKDISDKVNNKKYRISFKAKTLDIELTDSVFKVSDSSIIKNPNLNFYFQEYIFEGISLNSLTSISLDGGNKPLNSRFILDDIVVIEDWELDFNSQELGQNYNFNNIDEPIEVQFTGTQYIEKTLPNPNLFTNGNFESGVNTDNILSTFGITTSYDDTDSGKTGSYCFKGVTVLSECGIYKLNLLQVEKKYKCSLRYKSTSDLIIYSELPGRILKQELIILKHCDDWNYIEFEFQAEYNRFGIYSILSGTFYIDSLYLGLNHCLDMNDSNILNFSKDNNFEISEVNVLGYDENTIFSFGGVNLVWRD
jgi:hypothetical protein